MTEHAEESTARSTKITRRLWVLAYAVLLATQACNPEEARQESSADPVEQEAQPLTVDQEVEFSISHPQATTRELMLFSASEYLKINERVTISTFTRHTSVASFGWEGVFFGAGILGHNDIYAHGPVTLNSQTDVNGFARTESPTVTLHDNSVHLRGGAQTETPVPYDTTTWKVVFPGNPVAVPTLNSGTVSLPPGAYDQMRANGGQFQLSSGTYYVDDLILGSATSILADVSAGPVIIYVRDDWTHHGPIETVGGPEGSVLLGWWGQGIAPVKAPFVGAIAAPNGKVHFQRPDWGHHEGSFFARRIEVDSDCWVLPAAFDWPKVFPDPEDGEKDSDGDHTPDDDDCCPLDPNKQACGMCPCGVPETDSDDDGTPNCIDTYPEDPDNTTNGPCGGLGSAALKDEGTPCVPEACSGRGSGFVGECDGMGHCVGPGGEDCGPESTDGSGKEGQCVQKQYRESLYWFCTGPVSWHEASELCTQESGRRLVRIDRQHEGRWIANQLSGDAWVGGNDSDGDSTWHWANTTTAEGRLFWKGDADGERVDRAIYNWAPGEPTGAKCLRLADSGKWYADDCSAPRAYVCEQPKRYLPPIIDIDSCDVFPSVYCEGGGEEEGPDEPTYVTEAENPDNSNPGGTHSWVPESDANASNGLAFRAAPDSGATYNTNYVTNSPRLDFSAEFPQAGTYYVWVRGRAGGANPDSSDSVHVGLDGAAVATSDRISSFGTSFGWSQNTMDGAIATLDVPSVGLHSINVWMREDGFVIDKLLLSMDETLVPTGHGPGDGWQDDDDDDEEPCVDAETVGLWFVGPDDGDKDEQYALAAQLQEDCTTHCQDPVADATNCATYCTGFAAVPDPPETCDSFTDEELASCKILQDDPSFDPTASCDLGCGSLTCGLYYECAVPNSAGQLTPCANDAECGSDEVCGTAAPYCMRIGAREACDVKDGGGNCIAQCFDGKACGLVDEQCAVTEDENDPRLEYCSNQRVCTPNTVIVEPVLDPDLTNIEPEQFDPTNFFEPVQEPEERSYEQARPADCGWGELPSCEDFFDVGEHPWCNFESREGDVSKPDEPIDVADGAGSMADKGGTASSDIISFSFDPNLELNYDLQDFNPLSEGDFELSAEASAKATVAFNMLGVEGGVSIVDALARVGVERCGLSGDAYLKLFGLDFLPIVTCGDTLAQLDQYAVDTDFYLQCTEEIAEVVELLNRAKKALRDAQELVRQYRDLYEQGKRFRPDMCQELLNRNLPQGFPEVDCSKDAPYQVIGHFVNYYRYEVEQLVHKMQTLLEGALIDGSPKLELTIPFTDEFALSQDPPPPNNGCNENGEPSSEGQQIANVNFAIGPIPMNLTIEAFLGYQVNGGLMFRLDSSAVARALLPDPDLPVQKHDLASADLAIVPGASAGIEMFVGAGFDFGAVSAKVGLSGVVTLGSVSLPAYGGAALMIEAEVDDRPPPTDFLGVMPSYTLLFPKAVPQKLGLAAGYRYGLDADIGRVLDGHIDGKVRIKFFFFSKTWSVRILDFQGFRITDGPIHLIHGEDSTTLAEADTPLAMFQLPVPFPDFAEIFDLPPLPPYNPREFDDVRSLQMEGDEPNPDDPRYVDFDMSRAGQLLFDGYCNEEPVPECVEEGEDCSDVGCCDDQVCTSQALVGVAPVCKACAEEGDICSSASECCDYSGYAVMGCFQDEDTGTNFEVCQTCSGEGQLAYPGEDANDDGDEDGGCCYPLIILELGAYPTCQMPGVSGDPCAELNDCAQGYYCNTSTNTCYQ